MNNLMLKLFSPVLGHSLTIRHFSEEIFDRINRVSQKVIDNEQLNPEAQRWTRK